MPGPEVPDTAGIGFGHHALPLWSKGRDPDRIKRGVFFDLYPDPRVVGRALYPAPVRSVCRTNQEVLTLQHVDECLQQVHPVVLEAHDVGVRSRVWVHHQRPAQRGLELAFGHLSMSSSCFALATAALISATRESMFWARAVRVGAAIATGSGLVVGGLPSIQSRKVKGPSWK